jgi:hypothetical protein
MALFEKFAGLGNSIVQAKDLQGLLSTSTGIQYLKKLFTKSRVGLSCEGTLSIQICFDPPSDGRGFSSDENAFLLMVNLHPLQREWEEASQLMSEQELLSCLQSSSLVSAYFVLLFQN